MSWLKSLGTVICTAQKEGGDLIGRECAACPGKCVSPYPERLHLAEKNDGEDHAIDRSGLAENHTVDNGRL